MAKRTRETGNTQSRNAILPAPKTTIPIQQFTNRNAANAKASSSKPIKAGSSTSPPAPPPPAFSLSYGDGDYDAALPLFPDPNLGFHIIPAGKTERQEAKINNAFDAAAFLSHAFVRGMVGKWQSFSLEANGRSVALSVEDGEGTTIRFCTVRLPTPTQSTARGFDVVKETKDYTTKAEQHARLVLIREILNPSSDILEIKTPDFCDDDEEDDDQQAINTEAAESLLTEPQRQFQHFVQTTPRTNPLKTLRTNFSTTSAQLFVKSCAELIAMLEKGGSTLDPDPEGKFVSFGSWEPLANEMKLCCTVSSFPTALWVRLLNAFLAGYSKVRVISRCLSRHRHRNAQSSSRTRPRSRCRRSSHRYHRDSARPRRSEEQVGRRRLRKDGKAKTEIRSSARHRSSREETTAASGRIEIAAEGAGGGGGG